MVVVEEEESRNPVGETRNRGCGSKSAPNYPLLLCLLALFGSCQVSECMQKHAA